MTIGIIAYREPHRKSYDVITRAKALGYNVIVFAWPMNYQKVFKPIWEHRPRISTTIDTMELCNNLGVDWLVDSNGAMSYCNCILVAGGGIVDPELVRAHKIINAHPGYLPYARGLDALKWSILNGYPIAVTTHYLGDEIDSGAIIAQRIVPIYFEDTFHSLAQRVYDMEIDMLFKAIGREASEYIEDTSYPVRKRMPHHQELRMMEAFERLRSKSPSRYDH